MEERSDRTLSLLSAATVLVLGLILFKLFLSSRSKNLPPSPPRLPIIGHLHLVKDSLHRSLHQLSTKYGPILYLSFGNRGVLVVSSPSVVEECFAKNDVVLANRPRVLAGKYFHYNFTTIGAASYGSHWRNLRRLAALEILSTNRLNGFLGIREDEVRFLVKDLFMSTQQEQCQVEMKSRLTDLSFNVIVRMISGKRYFGKEVGNEEEAKRFKKLTSEMFELSGASNLCDYFPVLRWVGHKNIEKRMADVRVRMDRILQGLIDEHRKNRAAGGSGIDNGSTMTMVDVVLRLQESEPENYSDEIILGLMVVLITAGTDTSSVTIEWALAVLLNHPSALNKAKAEIIKQVGHDRLVNESDLPKLKYLNCVINETLRLYPAAPLLVPHAAAEDCTIGGYHVPKRTMVLVNAWAVHRSPDAWDDPESFKPERFEGRDLEGYGFVPFGVGRRACPGSGLANRVVGLGLAALIQCFDWERVGEEAINMAEGSGLTMPKLEPLVAMCKPDQSMIHILSNI